MFDRKKNTHLQLRFVGNPIHILHRYPTHFDPHFVLEKKKKEKKNYKI